MTNAMSAIVTGIVLWCAAVFAAQAEPAGIVAFGDSATSGYLIPRQDAYPAQLQRALRARGYDVTVKNAGVAGDTTLGALKRLDLAIDPGTAIAIVEFGVNDRRLRVPRADMEKRLGTIIDTLKRRQIDVLLVGYGGLDLSRVASRHATLYVAWHVAPGRHRARDGAHYDAEGYRIVVGQMLPAVETLLKRRRP
ncbi:MAG: arylesterase [Pseudolabrys sp.]|nr:arylesterase [Pseudolabrys sp.]